MTRILRLLVAVFGVSLFAQPLCAATIYSDFGPGNSYTCCQGWTVSGSAGAPGETAIIAMGFTAMQNARVGRIELGLTHAGGTNSALVSFWTEVGGFPNVELASWLVTSLPGFGSTSNTPVIIDGISGLNLHAGSTYYLEVGPAANNNDTWDAWNLNAIGAKGLVSFYTSSYGWQGGFSGFGLATFAVESAPEPATLALCIVAFGTVLRRRIR